MSRPLITYTIEKILIEGKVNGLKHFSYGYRCYWKTTIDGKDYGEQSFLVKDFNQWIIDTEKQISLLNKQSSRQRLY